MCIIFALTRNEAAAVKVLIRCSTTNATAVVIQTNYFNATTDIISSPNFSDRAVILGLDFMCV